MAILYGTTGDGTTLPVLVDQFGNLLAKGIDGQPGQPGPPGPPGLPELPPDPYEGALLGWEGGELSWVGGSVPLPEGTYGPFTYDSDASTLYFPQDVSSLIKDQTLYQSNALGDRAGAAVSTDDIFSVVNATINYSSRFLAINGGYFLGSGPATNGFDGSTNTPFIIRPYSASGKLSLEFNTSIRTVEIYTGGMTTYPKLIQYFENGSKVFEYSTEGKGISDAEQWFTVPGFPSTWKSESNGGYIIYKGAQDNTDISWNAIRINGDVLVDGSSVTRLVFPSTENFDLFSVGDVVQAPDITIKNIDLEEKTLTVSGGSWSGTDGSGQPGGQKNLSVVQEGSGTVFMATGNAIILRNDNGEWVDGFYATAPAQLMAARKVAAAAIKKKTN